MLFRISSIFLVLFFQGSLLAQNFTFAPGNDYFGQLEMDLYTEHYMYVYHDSQDSAYITWRKLENTCPVEWDFQMCDWQHCYSGMPTSGNMNGVAAGNAGNLRLIVNPFSTAGAGTVRFWIYPTGHNEEHVDVYFHFETMVTDIFEKQTNASISFYHDKIIVNQPNAGVARITDVSGKEVCSFRINNELTSQDISALPGGIYFCILNNQSYRFFKP